MRPLAAVGDDVMALDRHRDADPSGLRKLSKREIDRRIEDVVAEVARVPVRGSDDAETLEPRWISAAELVRRMRRFMVYN